MSNATFKQEINNKNKQNILKNLKAYLYIYVRGKLTN